MADNYIERQYEAYQARKAAWEKERKYKKKKPTAPAETPHRSGAFLQNQQFCTYYEFFYYNFSARHKITGKSEQLLISLSQCQTYSGIQYFYIIWYSP